MNPGTFTTLRREYAPLTWGEIVGVVSDYARARRIRWDDAARELARDALEDVTRTPHQA
jgi:hypothetical protein